MAILNTARSQLQFALSVRMVLVDGTVSDSSGLATPSLRILSTT